MFCHNCGAQVGDGVQFCPHCGQALGASRPPTPPASWTPPIRVRAQTGRWIGEGWDQVKPDVGFYAVLALVAFLLGSVPLIQGPVTAGFFIVCMKRTLNRRADFSDLFTGFNFFLAALIASLLIGLFVFAATLCFLIPGIVVAAMYKFTYLFIVDKRMDFWPAMEASRAVVRNDYFGFSVFVVSLTLLNILGFVCAIVGLLVTVPITVAAITIAYKETVGFDPATVQSL